MEQSHILSDWRILLNVLQTATKIVKILCGKQIIPRLSMLPDFHNAGYIHEPQDSAQLFHFYDARTKLIRLDFYENNSSYISKKSLLQNKNWTSFG